MSGFFDEALGSGEIGFHGGHCHPCEVCGAPVDCEDDCAEDEQQTIVRCPRHQENPA